MKKIIYTISFLILYISCTPFNFNNIKKDLIYPIDRVAFNKQQLKEGDIVIFKPIKRFTGSLGHIAIIGKDKKLVDFPNYYVGYREMPIEIISTLEYREVVILRYKYMTSDILEKIYKNIEDAIKNRYALFLPTLSNKFTYCSKFVKDVFDNAIDDKISLFPSNIDYILPLDFLSSGENFELIRIK